MSYSKLAERILHVRRERDWIVKNAAAVGAPEAPTAPDAGVMAGAAAGGGESGGMDWTKILPLILGGGIGAMAGSRVGHGAANVAGMRTDDDPQNLHPSILKSIGHHAIGLLGMLAGAHAGAHAGSALIQHVMGKGGDPNADMGNAAESANAEGGQAGDAAGDAAGGAEGGADSAKQANTPFLQTKTHDPDIRHGKRNEVYRALKRDHPEMSAEMKARIANRRSNVHKAERKSGPPYTAPLAAKH